MGLRKPDKEVVEDAIRQTANDLNGLLNLPAERDVIQQTYKDNADGFRSASTVSHDEIRSILDEFAADDRKDIDHVRDEVYFINPFNDVQPDGNDAIQDTIQEIYRTHVVFNGETVREAFQVPIDNADFFFDALEQRDLVNRLSRSHDVFTIGRTLEQNTSEPSVEDRLTQEAANGIISNHRFEQIIDAPVIQEVLSLFVSKDYIVDLDGEYLVRGAVDDYIESLGEEIIDDIEAEFEASNNVLLESVFQNEIERRIKSSSKVLSHVSDPTLRQTILDGTEANVREKLDIASDTVDGEATVVVRQYHLEQEVSQQAEDIFETIRTRDYAEAARYYDDTAALIEDVSIDGAETVNTYYRQAVRDECHSLIRTELFGRPADEDEDTESVAKSESGPEMDSEPESRPSMEN